jgi:hypothetical protein
MVLDKDVPPWLIARRRRVLLDAPRIVTGDRFVVSSRSRPAPGREAEAGMRNPLTPRRQATSARSSLAKSG